MTDRLGTGLPSHELGRGQRRRTVSQGAKALKIEVLIRVLGVALTVGTIVAVGVRFRAPVMDPFLPSVAVFFVAIVIGELFRITLPGSRLTAPMATAAALAFAMTVGSTQGATADYK